VRWIATKGLDVSVNPSKSFDLIKDSGVTRNIVRIEAKESFFKKGYLIDLLMIKQFEVLNTERP